MQQAERVAATRQGLMEAGRELAAKSGLANLRIDALVARAGVAKGTFYLHFRDRADLLVALHREFHDDIERRVQAAGAGRKAGLPALLAGTLAYLDACRSGHAVKALLVEARVIPEIRLAVHERNKHFTALAQQHFKAARWPVAAARLWVGLAAEAALAEAEAGKVLPAVRVALERFLGN